MAVKIKLKRLGKIHAPYYRIVVADSRTKRDGRAIEEIGKYHPKAEPSFIEVQSERAQYWLSVGAQPTDPVRRLLEITGDWQKFRGEPGSEGTLRTAAPKTSKSEIFAEVVGAHKGVDAAPKGKARKADSADKAEAKEAKADTKPAAKTSAKGDTKKKPAKAAAEAKPAAETVTEPAAEPEPAAESGSGD